MNPRHGYPSNPQERDEALRILYRLRAQWEGRGHDQHSPTALKAAERLIEEYEQKPE
jgi:hypothetical protein